MNGYMKMMMAMAMMSHSLYNLTDLGKFDNNGDWYKRYTTHKHSVRRRKKRKK